MDSECVFCDIKEIKEGLLDERDNFYLRASVRGAMAPGHVMLISKDHIPCFGAMPFDLNRDYSEYKDFITRRLEDKFSIPILIEQGIHGQSINHAHLHFLPSVSEWYNFSDKLFVDFLPSEVPVTKGVCIEDIQRVFEEEGQYVSIEERGQLYVCHTVNYNGILRPLREIPAKVTSITTLLHWQDMPESEREKNKRWIKETIRSLL